LQNFWKADKRWWASAGLGRHTRLAVLGAVAYSHFGRWGYRQATSFQPGAQPRLPTTGVSCLQVHPRGRRCVTTSACRFIPTTGTGPFAITRPRVSRASLASGQFACQVCVGAPSVCPGRCRVLSAVALTGSTPCFPPVTLLPFSLSYQGSKASHVGTPDTAAATCGAACGACCTALTPRQRHVQCDHQVRAHAGAHPTHPRGHRHEPQ
jgi:hypothetical protein